jgi:hypothetical protein
VLSVRLRYKDSDYPFGVFTLFSWPLCCLFVFDITILTTPLVSSIYSFDHCVVCSSSIYGFWLPLWCLQTLFLIIVLSVRLRYKDSDYPFGVFNLFIWSLCCLFLFDIMILAALWCLQTRLLTIVLSVRLRYKDSDYPFGVFKLFFWPLCCLIIFDIWILTTPLVSSNSSFDHCVVCSSSI